VSGERQRPLLGAPEPQWNSGEGVQQAGRMASRRDARTVHVNRVSQRIRHLSKRTIHRCVRGLSARTPPPDTGPPMTVCSIMSGKPRPRLC